jgi:hypothetical protein
MRTVESCLDDLGIDYSKLTEEQVDRLFYNARPHLPLPVRARGGNREDQLSWVSLLRHFPKIPGFVAP